MPASLPVWLAEGALLVTVIATVLSGLGVTVGAVPVKVIVIDGWDRVCVCEEDNDDDVDEEVVEVKVEVGGSGDGSGTPTDPEYSAALLNCEQLELAGTRGTYGMVVMGPRLSAG